MEVCWEKRCDFATKQCLLASRRSYRYRKLIFPLWHDMDGHIYSSLELSPWAKLSIPRSSTTVEVASRLVFAKALSKYITWLGC